MLYYASVVMSDYDMYSQKFHASARPCPDLKDNRKNRSEGPKDCMQIPTRILCFIFDIFLNACLCPRYRASIASHPKDNQLESSTYIIIIIIFYFHRVERPFQAYTGENMAPGLGHDISMVIWHGQKFIKSVYEQRIRGALEVKNRNDTIFYILT
jgi:hypothetical protein